MEVSVVDMEISKRKEYIQQKVQGHLDWLTTLDKKVNEGILNREDANLMVARAMTAREVKKEMAEDKVRKDPLTGLYNKRAFDEEYGRLIEDGNKFALLIVDLDNFKNINEVFGYKAGDSVILQMGLNFSANLRQLRKNEAENDFICRWGGDEFVILLKNLEKKDDLTNVAEKFKKMTSERAFSVKIEDKSQDIPAVFSIGGGIYKGEDKDIFFNKVDKEAIKQAKLTGKNKVVIIGE